MSGRAVLIFILFCAFSSCQVMEFVQPGRSKENTHSTNSGNEQKDFSEKSRKASQPDSQYKIEPVNSIQIRPDTLIWFEKTSCIQGCPEFSLTFFTNGDVYLIASKNLHIEGYFAGSLTEDLLQVLKNKLNEFEWQTFNAEYPPQPNALPNLPWSRFRLIRQNTRREVYCQYDCPNGILALSSYLEKIIPTLDWQEIRI